MRARKSTTLGNRMRIFFSKKRRDKWVKEYLKKKPHSVIVSGDFQPLPIFTALILQDN